MPALQPCNFSWIIDGLLAGCAFPSHGGHFQFFIESGIRHLVSLTEFTPPLHLLPDGLKHHHIPVEEFEAPDVKQIYDVHSIVKQAKQNNEGVVVHCYWGRGRTGTILASCLVALNGYKPDDAIREVRQQRPYSIETREQEWVIYRFAEELKKSDAVYTGSIQNSMPHNHSH